MARIKILPSKAEGYINLPSSKSDAHRKIIASCLAFNMENILTNLDLNNDVNATINAFKKLGQSLDYENKELKIKTKKIIKTKELEIDCFESGSTLRFLLPLFSLFTDKLIIKGTKKLLSRPLDVYRDIFKDKLKIYEDRLELTTPLKAGDYKIKGNISSQFISGLLFTLPLLEEDSNIEIIEPFESKPYVDMTIDTLEKFNIKIEAKDNKYFIKGKQKYLSKDFEIERDYSSLAFIASLGIIGKKVSTRIDINTKQGDIKIIDILKELGADISNENDVYTFNKSELKSSTISLKDNPDLGPILFALAPINKGTTIFTDTKRLKDKESDRIEAMKEELLKFNVKMKEEDNRVEIDCQEIHQPTEIINPHNDHRILMSLVVLSTLVGASFENIECVNKSYPQFFEDIKLLGIKEVQDAEE